MLFYRNGKTFSDEYSVNMIDEEKIGFLVKANQHHHTLLYFQICQFQFFWQRQFRMFVFEMLFVGLGVRHLSLKIENERYYQLFFQLQIFRKNYILYKRSTLSSEPLPQTFSGRLQNGRLVFWLWHSSRQPFVGIESFADLLPWL